MTIDAAYREAVRGAEAHHAGCFGCGSDNPASLGFTIVAFSGEELIAEATLRAIHDGAAGRAHGGVLTALLDEALGRVAYVLFGGDCMTASLQVDFRAPGATDARRYTVRARLVRREGRKIWAEGEVVDGETLVASATGLFIGPVASCTSHNHLSIA